MPIFFIGQSNKPRLPIERVVYFLKKNIAFLRLKRTPQYGVLWRVRKRCIDVRWR